MKFEEFDKPLDVPIDEVVEVEKDVPKVEIVDQKVVGISYEKQIVKETYRTTYHKATPAFETCPDYNHNWYMSDTGKYIASCSKCVKNRILLPTRHKLHGGHICDRDTGKILD